MFFDNVKLCIFSKFIQYANATKISSGQNKRQKKTLLFCSTIGMMTSHSSFQIYNNTKAIQNTWVCSQTSDLEVLKFNDTCVSWNYQKLTWRLIF